MKEPKLSKFVASTFVIASLAAFPAILPASAQTSTSGSSDNTGLNSSSSNTNSYRNNDGDNQWGWLGLLGLAGLAGLGRKRNHQEMPRQYDNDVSSSTRTPTSSTSTRDRM